jgi:uncharacterized membrane protein (UPF0127 family)
MRKVQAYFEALHGGHRTTLVTLEVARTPEERARGLMHRARLAPSTGMLFVFDEEAQHSMWMKNTFIPLDVLWLGEGARVVGVSTLTPGDLTARRAPMPVRYAVELPEGWYTSRTRGPHRLRLVRETL